MPIILVNQEARFKETRRIMVQSQPGKIVHKTLSQRKPPKKEGGDWWSSSKCRP
jgi:hypothetical protein